jgi:hypothetical protein
MNNALVVALDFIACSALNGFFDLLAIMKKRGDGVVF